MQLLGEKIDTQVAVLAGSRRGGNADDLARTALEDQEITDTDVMARDGDSVGSVGRFGGGTGRLRASSYSNVNLFPLSTVMVMVVITTQDTICCLVKPMAEGVVVSWIGV